MCRGFGERREDNIKMNLNMFKREEVEWVEVTQNSAYCKVLDGGSNNLFFLSTTNKMQRYTIFFITLDALHVSGGFSAHHQELKNCTHSIWYMLGFLLLPLAWLGWSSSPVTLAVASNSF
jgi:hypothetical protein